MQRVAGDRGDMIDRPEYRRRNDEIPRRFIALKLASSRFESREGKNGEM